MLDVSITAIHPSGYTIEIHLHDKGFDQVNAAIDALQQQGYRPSQLGEQWARTPTGEPICPRHKVVMKLRSKQHEEWKNGGVIGSSIRRPGNNCGARATSRRVALGGR